MKITKTTHSKLANTDFDNLSFGKSFSDHMFIANFKDGQWTNEEIVPILLEVIQKIYKELDKLTV